jgi:ATP-dependent Clp protease ATP-binding subunit ClpC
MSPKINVYLPDDLATEVKIAGIPVSAVCQQALADAVAASQGVDVPRSAQSSPAALEHSFTKRAYGVLADAEKAAESAGEKPTTVHLVTALGSSGGLALSVLRAADIEPDDVDDELRARARRKGKPGDLESVAERAVEQAAGLGHSYVGTEHLLLALTAGPPRELANATLRDMGLTHERALQGVVTALSAYQYARESLTFSGLSAPIRAALEDIRSRLVRLEEHGITGV